MRIRKKVETLDWRAFMAGEIKVSRSKAAQPKHAVRAANIAALAALIAMPAKGFAADADEAATVTALAASSGGSFAEIFSKALFIADWTAAGVFVFAGTVWMFGNRTKGLELLLSGSTGYLIVRHAVELRDWLKTI